MIENNEGRTPSQCTSRSFQASGGCSIVRTLNVGNCRMSRSVSVIAARGFVAGVALARFSHPDAFVDVCSCGPPQKPAALPSYTANNKAMRHTDSNEKCAAAGEQCKRSGTFIGPDTGNVVHGFVRQ